MTRIMRWGVCGAALFLLAASPSLVKAKVVYFNDFDKSPRVTHGVLATLGGITTTESVQGYAGLGTGSNVFGGEFLRNITGGGDPPRTPGSATTLTLTGLPSHTSVEVNFLLAIIDSWDGSASGGPGGCEEDCHPDYLSVIVDGVTVFTEAFGFNGPVFDPPQGVLLAESLLGFNGDHQDFAYDMGLNPTFDNIPHTEDSLTIEWVASGAGWQGGDDESWAIENLEVILNEGGDAEQVCVVYEPAGSGSIFNRAVAIGIARAERSLQVELATVYPADLFNPEPEVRTFAESGDCDLIMGVGFQLREPIENVAADYPEQQYAILDSGMPGGHPSVAYVEFLVDQAAYLAGYVVAGISETGTVGTFGGLPVPGVTRFMDGYVLGVEHFNAEHDPDVDVLPFEFTFNFVDPEAGRDMALYMYGEGADTVFAVAGLTGFGALDAAADRKAAGDLVRVVGVDFDWYTEFGDPDRVILTSVVKKLDVAAYNQIKALVDDTWASGVLWAGLEEDAVDIAPFHKLNNQVPEYLKNDLNGIREGIIDGSIPTLP